jgi:hypothetical protein
VAKFSAPATKEDALTNRLAAVIRAASEGAPRSRQAWIGPSEVGNPCVRALSYKLLDWPKTNSFSDPWPSVSGTAIHAWLANAFDFDKSVTWLTETKVNIEAGLSGTVDLFDVDNGIVIDHKTCGATSMKARKAGGPTEQQLVQVNLYGLGLERAGYTVNKVALAYYPLGGMLTGLHVWVGDYDRDKALEALKRLDMTKTMLGILDPEHDPAKFLLIPANPSNNCTYCPWFQPGVEPSNGSSCPGQSVGA